MAQIEQIAQKCRKRESVRKSNRNKEEIQTEKKSDKNLQYKQLIEKKIIKVIRKNKKGQQKIKKVIKKTKEKEKLRKNRKMCYRIEYRCQKCRRTWIIDIGDDDKKTMDKMIVCRNKFCHFTKAFIRIISKKYISDSSDEESSEDEESSSDEED